MCRNNDIDVTVTVTEVVSAV